MLDVTYERGPAKIEKIIGLRDDLAAKLKGFGDNGDKWTAEQVNALRDALADLHDGLEDAFHKKVNGYGRGDLVELRDQTVAKIDGFTADNTEFMFRRNNGLTGRSSVEYIKGRRA